MSKKQIHIYEVFVRTPKGENVTCRTSSLKEAKRAYGKHQFPRLRIDGTEQPILAADRLMKHYGYDIRVPQYRTPIDPDMQRLKPAE